MHGRAAWPGRGDGWSAQMFKPHFHLLFSPSAAGTLRATLSDLGRPDQVVSVFDNFSFGPFDSNDETRLAWIENELSITDWDSVLADSRPALQASLSSAVEPVVWVSFRDARTYAGFLRWLAYRGEAPCTIIDVTDIAQDGRPVGPDAEPVWGPGSLPREAMARLLDTQRPLSEGERRKHLALWEQLRSEDAPFRVIGEDGRLTSAPITCFDPLLLSCAKPEWWKAARIIGFALCEQWEANVSQADDIVLLERLCRLAESGALEARGDLSLLATCEFRLPPARSTEPLPFG